MAVATAVNKVLRMQFGLGVDADRIEVVPETAATRRLSSVPRYGSVAAFGGPEAEEGLALPHSSDGPESARILGGPLTRGGGDYEAEVVSAAIRHPASSTPPVVRTGATVPDVESAQPTPPPKRKRRPKPPPPGATPTRLGIERLRVEPTDSGVSARVTLSRAGRQLVGTAAGAATTYGVHRAVAEATLKAAQVGVGRRLRLEVVSVDIPVIGAKRVAVAQVAVSTREGKERLTGASEVRDDTRHAVVRATLDAINRRLESVLAHP